MEDEKISSVAKFCEHALCAIDNYPGHKIYRYDLQKIEIFFHFNSNYACPFDILEELENCKG